MKQWITWLALLLMLAFSLLLVRTWLARPVATPAGESVSQIEPSPAATETVAPTATLTATASHTPRPSPTPTASATPTPSPSPTPTQTPIPSHTPTPSRTPFATLQPEAFFDGAVVPTAVPMFEKPDSITNILLLGNDVGGRQGGRTDSIILVSIDEENKTASLLSLPRDLYVVIPGWKITRINLALPHGHGAGYPGGGGELVKDTILYNLGIEVDYYVRVGFDAFQQIVDLLGGVDVAVSCALEDWRLIDPELDPQLEENWEMFSLGAGIYRMDGDLALWYVRSRRSSSDFERGRRQQQILRAILNRGLDLDMAPQLPALWQTYRETVETDLPLPVMARLAALAPAVRENGIQHLFLPEPARRATMTSGGASVQLLQWEGAEPVLAQLMRPPVLNRAMRTPLTVEVVTPYDVQYLLAADNLSYFGFVPVRVEASGPLPGRTEATYFGDNFKGSFDWLLSWTLGIDASAIQLESAGDGRGDRYRVALGESYDPCRPQLEAPTLGRRE